MNSFKNLIEVLNLKTQGKYTYEGNSFKIGTLNIYGGQVLAQAIEAAYRTIDSGKYLNSIHSYFIHPGDQNIPIRFEVEVVKDGRSFDTRRVTAIQNDKNIFILAASFQIREEGLEHQISMPDVPMPEELEDFSDMFDRHNENNFPAWGVFAKDGPLEFRPTRDVNPFNPVKRKAESSVWFKPNIDFQMDNNLQLGQTFAAYCSDFNMLVTALIPHGLSLYTHPMQIASLDHAIWFYNEPDINDYMLYSVESIVASKARALCRGNMFTRDGKLVASIIQEGLIRKL